MKKLILAFLVMPLLASAQSELMQVQPTFESEIVPGMNDEELFEEVSERSSFAPPANDNCASATNIPIGTTLLNQTTIQSTVQSGESFGCYTGADQSVWYKFTATAITHVVTIDLVNSSGCYFSSAVWGPGSICVPTGPCSPISCQSASGGPDIHEHVLTQLVVGQTYHTQVIYNSAGPCGGGNPSSVGADFTIRVGNTQTQLFPSNPAPLSTCQSPSGPGCVFGTPPTVAQVTGGCPAYQNPITGPSIGNEVVRACFTVSTGLYNTSIAVQNVIQSNCGAGNVIWFNYTILNSSCQVVACGNLSNLVVNNLVCQTPYTFCLMYEIPVGCSHTQFWPYVNSNNVACTPLPIELLWFDAEVEEESVKLSWRTAGEYNNDYFVIEKSLDGLNFVEAVRFPGAGNTSTGHEYQTFDFKPYFGTSYYRLRQVDFDGTTTISSDVQIVNFRKYFAQVFTFSNESNILSFDIETRGNFSLFTADGKLFKKITVAEGDRKIDLSFLPKGFYLYRFETVLGDALTGKIVK